MSETRYTPIRPEGTFTVAVERTVRHDSRERMHYEYAFRVEARATTNDFVDHFARLVAAHGRLSGKACARMMGIDETGFKAALAALTGAGVREWADTFAATVAETLLRETSLPLGDIARATGFTGRGGRGSFSRWFRDRYKCTPREWRWANR
jgi:AraC-like DNA-binding protein